jgi:hypothetical protein
MSISAAPTSRPPSGIPVKESVAPISPSPGPTMFRVVAEPLIAVIGSTPVPAIASEPNA